MVSSSASWLYQLQRLPRMNVVLSVRLNRLAAYTPFCSWVRLYCHWFTLRAVGLGGSNAARLFMSTM
ncbi:hypothetical protein D3C80_2185290 [compost metagenome]